MRARYMLTVTTIVERGAPSVRLKRVAAQFARSIGQEPVRSGVTISQDFAFTTQAARSKAIARITMWGAHYHRWTII